MLKKISNLATRKQKFNLSILLLLMFLSALLETVGIAMVPMFVSFIIDIEKTIEIIEIDFIKNLILSIDRNQILILFSLLLVVFFILKNIFVLLVLFFENLFFFKFKTYLSNKLFRIYVDKDYQFHISKSPSELLRNTMNECSNVATIILLLLSSSREILVFICLFIFLLFLNPIVTISIFLLLLFFSLLFLKIFRNKILIWGKKSQGFNKDLILKITEVFNAIKYVKISKSENFFKTNFYLLFKKNEKLTFFNQFVNRSIRSYFELFSIISISILVIILKISNFNFSNFLIVLSLAAISIVRILPIFNTVVTCLTQIRFLQPSVDVIFSEVHNNFNLVNQKIDSLKNHGLQFSSLKLIDINFNYPDKPTLLKNISLELSKGEKVGFIGNTGSGKTTILDIILGLQIPTGGEIKLNNRKVNYFESKLPFNVGYVPQDVYLLDDTLKNNIIFDKAHEKYVNDKDLIKILNSLNLNKLIEGNSLGLQTVIGNNGIKLSGGEKQRIGIARAFLNSPDIIFFDEATSALDNSTESKVMNNFIFSNKRLTAIMIAHRLSTLEKCDCVYYVESGRIKDYGKLSDLLKRNPELK